MRRAIVTVGLGFGDEAKGACVDSLCRQLGADLCIRYSGGSQAGHNVELPSGARHCFSQFGAGTLAGVPTYLGQHVIIDPMAMRREAAHLVEIGLPRPPFEMLTVHPRCLVSTFFHREANRFKENERQNKRHGSCGHGIGDTRAYWLKYGSDAIFAEDVLNLRRLTDKMELLRQRYVIEFGLTDWLQVETRDVVRELFNASTNLSFCNQPPAADTVIFEGAQGVLLDENYGFYPHTTWSTVTPRHALEMAEEQNCEDVFILGVTRAYSTRHGKGPFPTEWTKPLNPLYADPGNPWNEWQQNFRVGCLDLVLLRYAAKVCGRLDGIAVNCLDHVDSTAIEICQDYGSDFLPPTSPTQEIQAAYGEYLANVIGEREMVSRGELLAELGQIAPVAMIGEGPTHESKSLVGPLAQLTEAAR